MNSKTFGITTVCLLFALSFAVAQTNAPLSFGYVHGTTAFAGPNTNTGESSETVLVFTPAKGGKFLALAGSKGDYRVPLEPGQYCVSAFDSSGYPLPLSEQQQKCIDVSAKKDVRLDVMLSRTIAGADTPSHAVELPAEIESQVLSGRILDERKAPIPDVLVEQLSPEGKTVESARTNAKGRYVMKPRAPWVYAMRVSKPGFDTLLFRVRISKSGKPELALTLSLSK